ncbi:DEAD/DEAH box helicase [Sphingomonas asaccharolytica]|uniref:DEAD/DEAH box helicase n=1 Tax=Sphingomonas asaccharolytica TaxID=40681 RepID=UPI00082B7C4C|nr:DEAD/DEAH box helicase [Sphingomonas asaccharolytica]
MMRDPREHQTKAVALLRDGYRRGKRRLILELATGAGKTFIAAIMIEAARLKGIRCLFIVDAISLIDQTVEALYREGLTGIGVIQADHPMTDWSKPIQVASVQTLRRRGMPAGIGLVIVDEAHCQDAWLTGIMQSGEWADTPFIGLSATPWAKGLGLTYEEKVTPITMRELIDLKLLSPFRVFASAHPDLSGVKIDRGDYHEGQLADVMSDAKLIADIVRTWKSLGDNRPTVAFCVDRAHAKKVKTRFIEAGIPWGYIDAYTDRTERKLIRDQLDRGEIKGVANVGCLTKGVDWALGCIILARPTKSEMLFVQMVGRGLRVNDGIPDCVILDHADNTLRMGFPTDIRHEELCKAEKGERAKRVNEAPLPKECSACSYLKPAKVHQCPACGFKPEKQSDVEEADGFLVEITKTKKRATLEEKQDWHAMLRSIQRGRNYAAGWVANTYRKRFGVWPRGIDESASKPPSQEVLNFVRGHTIRYVKGREKQAA